jgi:hypothetical protein
MDDAGRYPTVDESLDACDEPAKAWAIFVGAASAGCYTRR